MVEARPEERRRDQLVSPEAEEEHLLELVVADRQSADRSPEQGSQQRPSFLDDPVGAQGVAGVPAVAGVATGVGDDRVRGVAELPCEPLAARRVGLDEGAPAALDEHLRLEVLSAVVEAAVLVVPDVEVLDHEVGRVALVGSEEHGMSAVGDDVRVSQDGVGRSIGVQVGAGIRDEVTGVVPDDHVLPLVDLGRADPHDGLRLGRQLPAPEVGEVGRRERGSSPR